MLAPMRGMLLPGFFKTLLLAGKYRPSRVSSGSNCEHSVPSPAERPGRSQLPTVTTQSGYNRLRTETAPNVSTTAPIQARANSWSEHIARNAERLATQPNSPPEYANLDPSPQPTTERAAHATANPAETTPLELQLCREASTDPNGLEEPVLCRGRLRNVPGKVEEHGFDAEFSVSTMKDSNEATLMLVTPSRGKRRYALLDLEPPEMDGEFCLLQCRSLNHSLYLRFATAMDTEQFCAILRFLQKAAKANRQNPPVADGVDAIAIAPSAKVTTESVTEVPQLPETELAPIQEKSPSNVQVTGQASGQVDESLFSMDDFAYVANTAMMDVKEQVKIQFRRLMEIVDQVFEKVNHEVGNTDGHLSAELYQGVEEAAVEFWNARGFMARFDDDTKKSLLDSLHTIVLNKAYIHRRLMTGVCLPLIPETIPRAAEAAGITETITVAETTGSHLQYDAEEIEMHRENAVPCPEEIRATDYLPKPSLVTRLD